MKILSFDAYVLKWIAVIAMIANHIAIGLAPVIPLVPMLFLYAVGGFTYVIMAFFVVEGYRHTSNLKKYIGRLFLFGVIAQAFHPMVLGVTDILATGFFLNIMFTIILGLLVLLMYDRIKVRILFWLLFLVACIVAMFMDLFFVGVLTPLLYHAIKNENRRRLIPGIVAGIIFFVFGAISAMIPLTYLITGELAYEMNTLVEATGMTAELMVATPLFAIGCFLGAILIRNFNGERGRRAKWLFYVAYPLHLAIIALIAVLAGITAFNLYGFITF